VSRDACPDMCDAWAARDCWIRVIHQENRGLGAARNSGIRIITGELIGFVHSDDWLEPTMYEDLYRSLNK
ncbi:glycosyltransferase, partial [Bifidobacterium pseudocatenulatum]|nr:glycosyltransferase [Bifidobacterium pseudocatenulatum]